MKIAYFTDTYHPQLNGVVTSLDNFSNVYRSQDHTTYIIAPKIKKYVDRDSKVIRIPSMKIWPTLPDLVRVPVFLGWKYLGKIKNLDVDIVHAHGNGAFSLLGFFYAKLKKRPYVLTFHNLHAIHAQYFLGGKVLTPGMMKHMLKTFANNCDLIIAPSYKMEQELLSYGVTKRIHVVPNFIDSKRFRVKSNNFLHTYLDLPSDTPLLLAVGRLEPEKNMEFLLHTFAHVMKEDGKSHLVIVGEGRLMNKLVELSEKLEISERVHFTGGIDSSKMPYVYADAYMYVFGSFSEVHPMVTLEAATAGLPIVVVNDKAYHGAVIDGENGYIVQDKPKLFAEKILHLLKNPELARTFGARSKKIVQEHFSVDYATKKLMSLYEETVASFTQDENRFIPHDFFKDFDFDHIKTELQKINRRTISK